MVAQPIAPQPISEQPRAWTRKAEILAKRRGLDITALEIEPLDGEKISEEDLERYLESGTLEPLVGSPHVATQPAAQAFPIPDTARDPLR